MSEILDIKGAAEYLGVAPGTVRNWIAAGKLRAYRPGERTYRLIREEILQDVRSWPVVVASEIPEQPRRKLIHVDRVK